MPTESSPAIRARLIIREVLWWSRLVMTARRLPRPAPKAAPTLEANSGETSTLASPVTPYRPNRARDHRSPHTRLTASVAPSSTSLYGQTFTLALSSLDSPIFEKSPTTTPSARKALARTVAPRPTMASFSTAPGPTRASSQRMLPVTSAPSPTTAPGPITESATRQPASSRAPRPTITAPFNAAAEFTWAESSTQTVCGVPASRRPGISARSLP